MARSRDQLLTEALALPTEDRAHLAESLISSLDEDVEEVDPVELEREWLAEVARRSSEIDSGSVEPIPAEQVFRAARAELAAIRQARG
jgi:putative addiction module component (TIGR02574 family)